MEVRLSKLMLTRKTGESVTINDEEVIVTLEKIINNNQAQLSFTANKEKTSIWRTEIFKKRKQRNDESK